MTIDAKIIRDSVNVATGDRLTTLEVTMPRIVLAEFNTHRLLSRNSASSRAIPVDKTILAIQHDPFLPIFWGLNQAGMQAQAELSAEKLDLARREWLAARDAAIASAKALLAIGLHKQIANRILEPWMYTTVIVSATEWVNFFKLRCHPAAQPEMRRTAEAMRDAMAASSPQKLQPGDWHIPMAGQADDAIMSHETKLKVATAHLARVSYLTHDGVRDIDKDVELHDRLAASGHWSPFEHCARAADMLGQVKPSNFRGWIQYRKFFPGEDGISRV